MGKLTAKRVAKLLANTVLGNHYDGLGLRLEIKGPKAASWTSTYQKNGTLASMGLGSARAFTLAEARERNRVMVRQPLADKIDPLASRRAERASAAAAAVKALSFSEAAEAFLAGNVGEWRNEKHRKQWHATLQTYVLPIIGALSVADIDVTAILKVLEQHVPAHRGEAAGVFWTVRRETARRVRGRIETILNWATARKYRSGDNPAAWDTVQHALAKRSKIAVEHHGALPFAALSAFMAEPPRRCNSPF
jgi:hypothetical protein